MKCLPVLALEVYDNPDINNLDWLEATATFSVETNGEYYIGFHGYSIPYQGLLLLDDVKLDNLSSVDVRPEGTIMMYPNPATDQLNIKAEEVISSVSIYDISGSLVLSEKCNNQNISISISQMASGIYIINIETKNNISRKKLIIR